MSTGSRDHADAPILEFDPAPTAVIEPSDHIEPTDIPQHAVLCFFQDVIERAVAEHVGRIIDHVASEIGRNPIYELDIGGRRLALVHPGVAFRGVTFGQLLYAGDDLSGDAWNDRGWDSHAIGRELLFRLAAEACLELPAG